MHTRRQNLVAIMVAALAAFWPTLAAAEESVMASASHGFVGIGWNWESRNSLRVTSMVVADWGCDDEPVYGYLMYRDRGGHWERSPWTRFDHSGCDKADFSTYYGLTISGGQDIDVAFAVVCKDDFWDADCTSGGLSGSNPFQ